MLRVMDVLRSGGVRVAIGGGWGIDALLGEQTRAHRDLDLSFDADHERRVITSLRQAGFSLHEDQRPVRFVIQDAAGREIDLHPVVFDATGAGVQAGFEGMLRYRADGLPPGTSMDRRCCASRRLAGGVPLGLPTDGEARA